MTNLKKNIILIISLVIIIGAGLFYYLNLFAELTIISDVANINFKLTNIKNNQFQIIKPNQTIRLLKNTYKIESASENYQISIDNFKLNSNLKLKPVIDFSDFYQKKHFSQQADIISEIIKQKYSLQLIINNYWKVKNKGDFFIATITKRPDNPTNFGAYDIFKIIFKKSGDNWQQLTEPKMVFYRDNFPQIPVEILQSANDILTLN